MKPSKIALLLLSSSCLAGASCENRPDPPTAVETKVAVQRPCNARAPEAPAWAYDAAAAEMPVDLKVQRMRAELAQRAADRLKWQAALAECTNPNP